MWFFGKFKYAIFECLIIKVRFSRNGYIYNEINSTTESPYWYLERQLLMIQDDDEVFLIHFI
jgi:hypothetical protein